MGTAQRIMHDLNKLASDPKMPVAFEWLAVLAFEAGNVKQPYAGFTVRRRVAEVRGILTDRRM